MPFTIFGKVFGKKKSNRYKFESKGRRRAWNTVPAAQPPSARGRTRHRRPRRGRGATKRRRRRAKNTRHR